MLRAVKLPHRGSESKARREIFIIVLFRNVGYTRATSMPDGAVIDEPYPRRSVNFYAWYEVGLIHIAMQYVSGGDLMIYVQSGRWRRMRPGR